MSGYIENSIIFHDKQSHKGGFRIGDNSTIAITLTVNRLSDWKQSGKWTYLQIGPCLKTTTTHIPKNQFWNSRIPVFNQKPK